MILAVDPGDMTGLAYWTEEWVLINFDQCTLDEIPERWYELETEHGRVTLVIVEDYILFAKRAMSQTGSRMKASQGIGMVKALASIRGAEVIIQKASIKSTAMKWSQIKMPANHAESHKFDAYLHGYYYGVANGYIKTSLQTQKEIQRNGIE